MTIKPKTGAERIMAERARQVSKEGYDARHDDQHDCGGLAMAAACYAAPVRIYIHETDASVETFKDPWPWEEDADKRPSRGNVVRPESASVRQRIRLLEKAGALCAAEIDRLLRDGGGEDADQ